MNRERSMPKIGFFTTSTWVLILGSLSFSIVFLIWLLTHYNQIFVHPHVLWVHLPIFIVKGLGFQWQDLINPFIEHCSGENRTRFLAYAIVIFDLRLRLLLEQYFVLPPTFSVIWFVQIFLTPYFLYKLMINLCGNRQAALISVGVLISSIGFLSGFTMLLLPSKALTIFVMILILYLFSELDKSEPRSQLLFECSPRYKNAIFALLLSVFFIDETAWFVFVAAVVVFPHRFFNCGGKGIIQAVDGRFLRNSLFLISPVLIFVMLELTAIPALTQHFFGYRHDFFGTLFLKGKFAYKGHSLTSGQNGGFSLQSTYANLRSLFGSSLVPWQLSPFLKDMTNMNNSGGDVVTGQKINIAQTIGITFFLLWIVSGIKSQRSPMAATLFRIVLAGCLYVVFVSILSGRHIPYFIGYYYGSAFSVFFVLAIGLSYAALSWQKPIFQLGGAALAMLITLVQVINFTSINRSWVDFHIMKWPHNSETQHYNLDFDRVISRKELQDIHQAWHNGSFNAFLNSHKISPGALYLVLDLQTIDRLRGV